MALVLFQVVRQQILIAQAGIVDKGEACEPVAMFGFAVSLNVVLTTGEVPEEVAPVHPVALIAEEEREVVQLRRNFHHDVLTAAVVGHTGATDLTAHPVLVVLGMVRTVHTGEQHVLSVDILVFGTHHEVRVFLVLRGFLLTLPHGLARVHARFAIATLFVEGYLRGVGLSVEEGTLSVLVAA